MKYSVELQVKKNQDDISAREILENISEGICVELPEETLGRISGKV